MEAIHFYEAALITVDAQQDTILEADSDDGDCVLMVNKSDPFGPHPLPPLAQPFKGKPVIYDLYWGDG